MSESRRLPITCATTGVSYVAPFQVGSGQTTATLIVDTGSSATAVDANSYNPGTDSAASTGDLMQKVTYSAGGFVGAAIQGPFAIAPETGSAAALPAADFSVAYSGQESLDGAQGILGLGFKPGNPAYPMPGNTWQNRYPASQQPTGAARLLDPILDQFVASGQMECAFALGVRRSLRSQATADDPANNGVLVLGGGLDCTDLYTGTPAYAQVTAGDKYYTNLLSIEVQGQPIIQVAPPPSWNPDAVTNSFIDSGAPSLTLSDPLYKNVLAAFGAINPAFETALSVNFIGNNTGIDQTTLSLANWPALILTLQGNGGANVTLTIAASDYWQFDARGKGQAVAAICSDQGEMGGQSILGLPLFAGNFVLFDRTAAPGGPGRIGFARLAPPPATA